MKNIDDMTIKEMVAEYNALTGKSIKKFASRAAGEKQLAKARKAMKDGLKASPEVIEKVKKMPKVNVGKRSIAEGVADTWTDPHVAAKRSERHGVIVNGTTQYRSVRAAFLDLGLPMKDHIKFRINLKAKGKLTYDKYDFAIVS